MPYITDLFEQNPVIPAVAKAEDIPSALAANSQVVFILFGNIITLPKIAAQLHQHFSEIFVAVDLIEGLASHKDIVAQYIKAIPDVTGIISNKPQILRSAKSHDLLTIHRFFIIDSRSLYSLNAQYKLSQADVIDLMPGIVPQILDWVIPTTTTPIIASGLISRKSEMMTALNHGAAAISTTNPALWRS